MTGERVEAAVRVPLAVAPGPLSWHHAVTHYLISPWRSAGSALVRGLGTGSGTVGTTTRPSGTGDRPELVATFSGEGARDARAIAAASGILSRCLGLAEDVRPFYDELVPADPVLAAASEHGLRGARLRISPTVFEAMVTALATQNVQLRRTYTIMRLLTERFGTSAPTDEGLAADFPRPADLAEAPEADLRACGLGYRAPLLRRMAAEVAADATALTGLDDLDDDGVRERLLRFTGMGPYSTELVLSIGLRRPAFQLDSYTRLLLDLLYGVRGSDGTLRAFVEERFGPWRHYAMLLLTTDTHLWSPRLGVRMPIRSAAALP